MPQEPVTELICDAYSPVCPQQTNPIVTLPSHVTMGLNCLTINIWSPKEIQSPLPVMVWVHGGAFMFGSSHQPEYEGTQLAQYGNVVVVTLNYRVGPLGFLDLSGCAEPGEFDTNVGIRDVLLALRWVQEHIVAFGGDPSRVTIFGESSGGAIVTTLLASPHAEGLFQRAIAQSAPATSVYGSKRAFHIAQRLLRRLGISAGDAIELDQVPTDEILAQATDIYERVPEEVPGTLAFAPVVDGDIVPESPIDVLHSGRGLDVPLIIGTNRNEASVFKYMHNPILPITEDRIRRMLDEVKEEQPDLEVPPLDQIRGTTEGIRRQTLGLGIARDIGFRLPAVWIAEGHRAEVWLYRFDHSTPLLSLIGLGAPHASEIPYVWRNLDTPMSQLALRLGGRKTAQEISQRMSGWWAAFAHGISPWPTYTPPQRRSLIIEREERVVNDLDAPLRDGWGEGVLAFS